MDTNSKIKSLTGKVKMNFPVVKRLERAKKMTVNVVRINVFCSFK